MFRKAAALCLTAVTALSLAACGTNTFIRPEVEASGATLAYSLENSWKVMPLLQGEELELSLTGFLPVGEQIVCIDQSDGEVRGAVYSIEADTYTLLPDHAGHPIGAAESEDGSLQVFWQDAQMDEHYVYTHVDHWLVTYGADFTVTGEELLTWPDISVEDSVLRSWMRTRDGGQLMVDGMQRLHYYDPDGVYKGQITGNMGGLCEMFTGADGTPCVQGATGAMNMAEIDTDALNYTLFKPDGCPEYLYGFYAGNGDYRYFVDDGTELLGVRSDTGEVETVINYHNSDMNRVRLSWFYALPDGDILFMEYGANERYTLHRLQRRTQEEIDSMKLISVAAYQISDYLEEMIVRWNRQSPDVHFVVKVYNEPMWQGDAVEAEEEKVFSDFKEDLLRGVVPDVFLLNNLNYEMLSNKGILEDLRPYMEQDPAFCEEDYFMNFFDALEYRGALDKIGFSFDVETLAAKTEYLNGKTPNTIGEFAALADTLPDGMQLFSDNTSREILMYRLIAYNSSTYIDWDTGTWAFDTQEMAKLLEICMLGNENAASSSDPTVWRDDKALVYTSTSIFSLETYHGIRWGSFGDEPMTMFGIPQQDPKGNGGLFRSGNLISMCSASLYKEEIWEFIKFCLLPENQTAVGEGFSDGFPVNREAFDRIAETKTQSEWKKNININGIDITTPPTQQEAQELKEFIDGMETAVFWNEPIAAIIEEEAGMFLAGDCTAQHAAENMKSRVNIYLSEQL